MLVPPVLLVPRMPSSLDLFLPPQELEQAEPVIIQPKQLALLLPAHNEELIIETTIRSAIAAGQAIEDIYVVNDNSSDSTKAIATRLLGKANVLNVKRSGKALAVKKAIDKFKIEERYTWLHVADADSIFSQDYFRHYCSKLDPTKYAVAVGFVQSLRGNWISTYRALTYTYSQQVTRRVQSRLGMISVFPGPITCFRTDIISKLEFGGASLTEDFDITLQVHRKKLGKILFIPKAVNYTQDPQTLSDFCKQNMRWQRGFFQGVKKYKIGMRGQLIDVSLGFQMLQTILFLLQLFVLFPYILITTQNWMIIPVVIAGDIIVNGAIALFSSAAAKRWNLIGALPYFYFLRWLEVGIYIIAFVEVMILGRFQTETIGWSTAGRRYKLSEQALLDVAK
jgi:cellulose synthase/poly-beta-1,6-N-acetylglucosamine synthase-like glycosyltransferase